MANSQPLSLSKLSSIEGFTAACLVDGDSGLMLSQQNGNSIFDIEAAGAATTEVIRAKRAKMESLGLDDQIEELSIALGSQLHLVRPLASNPTVFINLVVDRSTADLSAARMVLKKVEETIEI